MVKLIRKRIMDVKLSRNQGDLVKTYNSQYGAILGSGGAGAGKTYAAMYWILFYLNNLSGCLFLCAAQTMSLVKSVLVSSFLDVFPSDTIVNHNRSDNFIELKRGNKILFRSLDEERKIKGLSFGGAYVDELTEIDREIYDRIIVNLRQKNTPQKLIATTNPSSTSNWVYEEFYKNRSAQSKVINFETENAIYLSDLQRERLEHYKKTNPAYFDRMYRGRWGMLEGLVYNLTEKNYLSSVDRDTLDDLIIGLDFGYEHPTALVLIGIQGENFILLEEFYRKREPRS